MHRFFLALVCAAMVFLGVVAAHADKPRRWAHWTFRPMSKDLDGPVSIDKPGTMNTSGDSGAVCIAHGYTRQKCLSASVLLDTEYSQAAKCACAVTWTHIDRSKVIWHHEAHAGPASSCIAFVTKVHPVIHGPVEVRGVDEVCLSINSS